MTRLSVALLGSFQVTLDGTPVTHFESARVRALLALLAAEAERPHTREAIAELLWPERPPGAALADLRHAWPVCARPSPTPAHSRPFSSSPRRRFSSIWPVMPPWTWPTSWPTCAKQVVTPGFDARRLSRGAGAAPRPVPGWL